jgi:DNA-binding HxlR family transcriptional regulator
LARALIATGDHWTLMIVLALAPGRMRLTQLHNRLPGVSTGVLERYVQQMVTLGIVERTRFKEMPPRVELELTDAGRELLPVVGALARWGMRNRWSPPADRERVELGVLLHVIPLLLEGQPRLREGRVEMIVAGAHPPLRCEYLVHKGRLRLADTDKARATVRIEGNEQAWIAALGPEGDHTRLRFTGDKQLAKDIFAALPR